MKTRQLIRWIFAMAVVTPAVALAHVGWHDASGGFLSGVGHPFSGVDHLLAMLAVGIWAGQSGSRCFWAVPIAFVVLMLLGAGMAGLSLPYVEQGIVASLVVLGLLIAGACRLNILVSATIVGFFAVFHGMAHGAEMPAAGSAIGYTVGFALATAFLHGAGIGAAKLCRQRLTRFVGMGIALSGLYLTVA